MEPTRARDVGPEAVLRRLLQRPPHMAHTLIALHGVDEGRVVEDVHLIETEGVRRGVLQTHRGDYRGAVLTGCLVPCGVRKTANWFGNAELHEEGVNTDRIRLSEKPFVERAELLVHLKSRRMTGSDV